MSTSDMLFVARRRLYMCTEYTSSLSYEPYIIEIGLERINVCAVGIERALWMVMDGLRVMDASATRRDDNIQYLTRSAR